MKANLVVFADHKLSRIHKEIYGHFSEHLGRCIYEGLYVGEDSLIPNVNGIRKDVLEALREISVPVLRWPGGCFADEYHWKDGIGPKNQRKRMINTNWGGVVEDNSFGTHEFLNLCEELGCEPYIAGNLGSGTVQELSEWIEYMTFDGESPMANWRRENGREKPWKIKYLGIGNESWGCGGSMEPEYYASEYRRYQSFCKDFSGNSLYKIACGPDGEDTDWTRRLLSHMNSYHTKAITLHYYTVPTGNWDRKGSACVYTDEEYYETLRKTVKMDEIIRRHLAVMEELDPKHEISLIVDEWGCWYDVEEGTNPGFLYQQNTMRDAMVAAANLHIFNQHCDRVRMANLAQVVNVLQAVLLTEGERMIKTPTYYVFYLLKGHQDATLLESHLENQEVDGFAGLPMLNHTVSEAADGSRLLTLSNLSLTETAQIAMTGMTGEVLSAQILNGEARDYNTFDDPDQVHCVEYHDYEKIEGGYRLIMPPCSVLAFRTNGCSHGKK